MSDLSVVIPTFDRTQLLIESVRSVLAQTVRPREIIVVDNGHVGHASGLMAQFGSAVRSIRSVPGEKQLARNAGIAAAQSEWIATLDDDDLWKPEYLEVATRAIAAGQADIIGTDHRKFEGPQAHLKSKFDESPPGYWDAVPQRRDGEEWTFIGRFPRHLLLQQIPFFPSSLIVRRRLALEVGGYDPRMKGVPAEDVEYLARVLGKGDVAVVWRPLVQYRLHPGNATACWRGQEIGRWRVFEFIRQNHKGIESDFSDALDQNLPARRARIFDLAFGTGDYRAMTEVRSLLGTSEWNARRRILMYLASLPQPLAKIARQLLLRGTGRSSYLRNGSIA